ncbi:MAG: adenine methylase Dam [Chitinophagaceae bacterium]|nr:adenine methylase Dam [Chitinophagaceae bacterium]
METTAINAKPFLRWAGGKKWFIKYLNDFLPVKFNNYHEIFLGSASAFFNIPAKSYKAAYLSDVNEDLINAFVQIKENIAGLIKILNEFKNTEAYYYKIRNQHDHSDPVFRAARLIFMNKTGYNGIYRVNSLGRFNVPYGHRENVDFVSEMNLLEVNKKLANANISNIDFEEAIAKVRKGDLVFIDPPYTVAHENNGFIEYNKKLFSLDDQIRLSKAIQKIISKGAYYLLTNAKHEKILEIYSHLQRPKILERHSHIGGNGAKRENIKEYIFTNCIK